MPRPENRTQLMAYFGATQRNTVWSWCAVNHDEKKAYFSVWTDLKFTLHGDPGPCYLLQRPDWGVNEDGAKSPARNDHDEKFALVFDAGYQAFGYFIVAKDPTASTREIAYTKTSFIFSLQLRRNSDGSIVGFPLERIEVR